MATRDALRLKLQAAIYARTQDEYDPRTIRNDIAFDATDAVLAVLSDAETDEYEELTPKNCIVPHEGRFSSGGCPICWGSVPVFVKRSAS